MTTEAKQVRTRDFINRWKRRLGYPFVLPWSVIRLLSRSAPQGTGRIVQFDLARASQARTVMMLVRPFAERGYTVRIRFYLNKAIAGSSKSLVNQPNIEFTLGSGKSRRDVIRISDNAGGRSGRNPTVRINYDYSAAWKAGQEEGQMLFPYSVHPGHPFSVLPEDDLTKVRRHRIFFSGNWSETHYGGEDMRKHFGMLSRFEIVDFVLKEGLLTLRKSSDVLSGANPENDRFVIDRQYGGLSTSQFATVLEDTDFFLAPPGVTMPVCHNLVEAMAKGAIPVTNYPDWFYPNLEHGRNCFRFQTLTELREVLATIESLEPSQVSEMRQNVLDYYKAHLDGQTWLSGFEAHIDGGVPVTLSVLDEDIDKIKAAMNSEGRNPHAILYIGNKLSGHGFSPTNIETLGPQLASMGYRVRTASSVRSKPLRMIHMLWVTLRHIRQVDAVIIDTYSTWNFYYAYATSQVCRLFGVPYIPILHGGNLPQRMDRSRRLATAIFKHSLMNVAPSGYLQKASADRGYEVAHIPNNIEIGDYDFRKRETVGPRLLYVRALKALYNPTMAIRVLAELRTDYPDAHLCMIGPDLDGSLAQCRQLASELAVENAIEFTGRLSKEEWRERSTDRDIFISTTNFDNTPVSVIEAMALGLPVVSTNPGGVPFLVDDGQTGLLVPCGDTHQMVQAIRRLIESPELATRLSVAGRAKAESFGWDVVRKKWEAVLDASTRPNLHRS